jgi:predicted PhzF superfamily epimerase YddE/YHI9
MEAIIHENHLFKPAFARQSNLVNFGMPYFTTEEEIHMAGHLTFATSFALVKTGCFPFSGSHTLS